MSIDHMTGSISSNGRLILIGIMLAILAGFASCSSNEPAAPEKKKKTEMSVPSNWYLSLYNSSVLFKKAEEKKKGYTLLLDRTSDLQDADYYLRVAESLYPQRRYIEKSIKTPEENWFFERLWWYEKHKDFLIPFALTADSVNYYINKYKETKTEIKKINSSLRSQGSNMRRIEFAYIAEVKDEGNIMLGEESVPKVRVVLTMKWYDYCGQPCGWGFEKQREVVFAGRMKVLSISGDGPTRKWVSSSKTPYGPSQWIRF